MSSSNQLTAFLGATGGCCANALACTLKDGRSAVARKTHPPTTLPANPYPVARTPDKLTKLLLDEHSIPQSTLDAHLTIVPGSATDVPAVKALLAHGPATIISGVGGAPALRANPLRPFGLDQPTICADTVSAMVAALRELAAEGKPATKPRLVVISSTGIGRTQDLPLAMRPLYRWALVEPHADKRAMETAVVEAALAEDSPLAGFVVVRPAFLLDGKGKGVGKVRVGWERHAADEREAGPGPAVGYTIARADVGGWIFEELVKGNVEEWDGRCVSLTY